jgi:hypothetical protein
LIRTMDRTNVRPIDRTELALGAASKPLVQFLQGSTRWNSRRVLSDFWIARILGAFETIVAILIQMAIGGALGLAVSTMVFAGLHLNGRYVLTNGKLSIRSTTSKDLAGVGLFQFILGLGFMIATGIHLDIGTMPWGALFSNSVLALLSAAFIHGGIRNNSARRRIAFAA